MELTQDSRELIDRALYRRKLLRWRIKSAGLLLAFLLMIPAYSLSKRFFTHAHAAGRLEALGGRVDYRLDPDSWTMSGTSDVWFVAPGFFNYKRGSLSELEALTDVQNLTSLDLSRLESENLHDFGFLRPLIELESFKFDRISPAYPGGLTPLPASDSLIKELPNLPALKYIQIPGNKITDAGLARLATLKKVEDLDLTGTLMTDAGLKHLIAMKSLRSVFLSRSKATSVGVLNLQAARPDLQIEFDPKLKPFHAD